MLLRANRTKRGQEGQQIHRRYLTIVVQIAGAIVREIKRTGAIVESRCRVKVLSQRVGTTVACIGARIG